MEQKDTSNYVMLTQNQLANIFTKLLDETRFCFLRSELNILDFCNLS
jgi:hypothetical protein